MNTIDTLKYRKPLKTLALWLALAALGAGATTPVRADDWGCRSALQLILDPARSTNQATAHSAITADLYSGEIVATRRFSQDDNKHALYLVNIRATDPYSGAERYREAFFKPRVWGDEDGWARAPMEYAAYFVNRQLGMDYVAPTAYRRGLRIEMDGNTFTEGSLIYRIPEFKPLAKLPYERFAANNEAILSDNRVLSVMMLNQDEHYWNLGVGQHWVDGQLRPAFIDWGASLRHDTRVTMTEYHAYGNSRPVTQVRRQTLEALERFQAGALHPLVDSGFMSWDEANGIASRAHGIASYFRGLAQKAAHEGRPESDVILNE